MELLGATFWRNKQTTIVISAPLAGKTDPPRMNSFSKLRLLTK